MDTAELSSIATAVDELAGRISHFVEEEATGRREDAPAELLEVERALQTAARRLRKLVETATGRR